MATSTGTISPARSVLIVDDESPIRELLRRVLTDRGYHVLEAPDGRKAMDLVKNHEIDLVITDLVMPEQEGLETILQLRRDFPRLKVIAVSGYDSGSWLRHAAFLAPRPPSASHLKSTIC